MLIKELLYVYLIVKRFVEIVLNLENDEIIKNFFVFVDYLVINIRKIIKKYWLDSIKFLFVFILDYGRLVFVN